jgi:hypothetical protein
VSTKDFVLRGEKAESEVCTASQNGTKHEEERGGEEVVEGVHEEESRRRSTKKKGSPKQGKEKIIPGVKLINSWFVISSSIPIHEQQTKKKKRKEVNVKKKNEMKTRSNAYLAVGSRRPTERSPTLHWPCDG